MQACYVADGWWSRLVGLLGTPDLGSDEALWIEPCSSVHTFGMRSSIDVVFVDGDSVVVKVVVGVAPWRLVTGGRGARVAVEGAAGTFSEVAIGARLRLETP